MALNFDEVLTSFGFKEMLSINAFLKASETEFIILRLYVDDLLLCQYVGLLHETKQILSKTFE